MNKKLTPTFLVLLTTILALAITACQSATPEPTATPVPTEAAIPADTATAIPPTEAPTATEPPTSTPTAVPTDTPTAAPTDTPPPSPTTAPSLAPTLAATQPPAVAATQPPAVAATKPPAPAASGSVYGSTTGPAGFATTITCSRPSGDCLSVIPPGDVSFSFTLSSTSDAPWALFLPYGLSVEKDGVNADSMFMFVDAGWLPPGVVVRFGGSRNFTEPGRYVIRSSGCMLVTGSQCAWTTMAGTTVTFVIQP
jgi:hypothetical protein